jgi:hypothetical protein
VGWKVEVDVVNPLHFESWWEIEMVLGNFAAPQNVNLGLSVDSWSIGETIYRDSLVRVKDWVGAVGKASRLLVGVKAIE